MSKIEQLAEGVTLYLGDYRDAGFDLSRSLVVTDPPYNIGFGYRSHLDDLADADYIALIQPLRNARVAILQYPEETMRYVVPALGVPRDCLAWCYNSNLPRQFRLWNIYGRSPDFNAVRQPAKNNIAKVVSQSVRSYDWFADIQQVKGNSAEKTAHPCQAPVALFERVIALCAADGETIVDPFMGSGSCGVAAINAGHQFIGAEKDPAYFEIARERLLETIHARDLFIESPEPIKQEALEL